METLQSIAYGFGIFLTPANLLYCFLGVLLGTLVGVLPGLGSSAAISLLLPLIFRAPPVGAFIMLAGILYGAQYGGSTTSILLNIPGEITSVVTCFDGYQMALQGRAGPALGISAFGSFIGGTFGIIGLMLFGPPLASFAISFGPPEYCALAVLSMTLVSYLNPGKGSQAQGLMMACFGVILSTVGMDPISSRARFTFGFPALMDGFGIIYVTMGLFGMSDVLINLDVKIKREVLTAKIKHLFPTREDWRASAGPITRGTLLGFFLGLMPGLGVTITTFFSYALEKRRSKHPETFGRGAIEGVAGPETANNAAASGTFIPLLSLGIPTNAPTAILLGALIILGLQPGPLLISSNPDLFWGVIASMYIGNVMLVALNLPLIGLWVQILKIPYSILAPLIVIICAVGAYSVDNDVNGILIMNAFGLLGYLMKRYEFSGAPLILGLILGPMFEKALRRSLILSEGSLMIFLKRPLSAVIFLVVIVILISPLFTRKGIMKKVSDLSDD